LLLHHLCICNRVVIVAFIYVFTTTTKKTNYLNTVLNLQVARKLAMVEADLGRLFVLICWPSKTYWIIIAERAEERAEAGEKWVFFFFFIHIYYEYNNQHKYRDIVNINIKKI
jgi:hypothetical protein